MTTPVPPGAKPGQPDADVNHVRVVQGEDGTWTFHVTVEHPDTGWEDYADGWDVVTPDGTVLKVNPDDPFTRLLLHPHETEQDIVNGFGGQEIIIDLEKDSGPGYEVER
jgi:hypothetical protein